jgi:hypothetical protein
LWAASPREAAARSQPRQWTQTVTCKPHQQFVLARHKSGFVDFYSNSNRLSLTYVDHRPRSAGDGGDVGRLGLLPPPKKIRTRSRCVPIHALLHKHAFGPEDVKLLASAFEDTLRALRLVDRNDPMTTIVAKKIIELAQSGERDPIRLRDDVVKSLST